MSNTRDARSDATQGRVERQARSRDGGKGARVIAQLGDAQMELDLINRRRFAARHEAWLAIFEYVETFYNRVRLHSALGFQSPVDFEQLTN